MNNEQNFNNAGTQQLNIADVRRSLSSYEILLKEYNYFGKQRF